MPSLTLADALRYFFAAFVLYGYLLLLDANLAKQIIDFLGLFGIAAVLAVGALVYVVYRYFIYDIIIMWLRHVVLREQYRSYIIEKYIPTEQRNSLNAVIIAERIISQISDPKFDTDRMRKKAAAVHFLYQASLLALPMIAVSYRYPGRILTLFYVSAFIGFGFLALCLDRLHERDELAILKSLGKKLNAAAANVIAEHRPPAQRRRRRRRAGNRR
jgi:hypothetical protein